MTTAVIHLSYHQAQAVAERAARIRARGKKHGLKENARVIVTQGNPYYGGDDPSLAGIYLQVEGSQAAPIPLFAKDLGHDRDFAAARLPARDENGHVSHPDMEGIGWDEFDMGPQLRALGWNCATVEFDSDASSAMKDRYSDSESPDCSYWRPSLPRGDGWLLASIYETEDGPVALYVRPASEEVISVDRYKEMVAMFQDQVVAKQAAWIEWRHPSPTAVQNTHLGSRLQEANSHLAALNDRIQSLIGRLEA